jgi:K+-transporting ATPase ATPase A chain
MAVMFLVGLAVIHANEVAGNPALGVGTNMEGKEQRFGAMLSALWAASTTAASNGSVNAMHDSFMPLSGLVMMVFMAIGEVIFGGVGAGLYGMLLHVVLAVFLAGLMVGRTPEYLGRKIEAREVTLAVLAFLSMPLGILEDGAIAAAVPQSLTAVQDPGPHGSSEILYAYSSATGNNGSAFGGWGAAGVWHTTALGIIMLIGRYAIIVPMLAIAGSMIRKTRSPVTSGTFPTHGPLFVTLLILTVLILGALTFFPVLALGPIAEETARMAGQSF